MAETTIRTKELPIVDLDVNINTEDRVVATHVVDQNTRQTVGITIGALRDRFISDSLNNPLFPKNIFSQYEPTSDVGNDGDLYFKTNSGTVESAYFKMDGVWYPFKISDDNWNRFLNGQSFDVISDATSVKAYAFQNNTLIRRVIMPKCITVYEHAFEGCKMTELNMPKLETVYESAFAGTRSWNSTSTAYSPIDLTSLKTIGNSAFRGIHGLSSAIFLNIENVESIGNSVFWESNSIVFTPYDGGPPKLILPKCKHIGNSAFGAYYSIYSRNFHDIILESIETIGSTAFQRCDFSNVNENSHAIIVFGENVTYIDSGIFGECGSCGDRGEDPDYDGHIYGLYMDMYVKATTPPALNGYFRGKIVNIPGSGDTFVRDLIPNIYVPEESIDLYKSATRWSVYADYIQAIPSGGVPGYDNT